nr:twin-arginine translocation signal domain-containing protein [Planctomycetota bacterium]
MTKSFNKSNLNRRQFLKQSGSIAAGAAVLGSLQSSVFARGDSTIRLALIGCGGRGTGAVGNALYVPNGGLIKLYATADLISEKMEKSL